MGIMFISCGGANGWNVSREGVSVRFLCLTGSDAQHSSHVIGVRVGGVVQDHHLGQVPPQDAEVFDVVALDAGAVLLIQTMSAGETHTYTYILHSLVVFPALTS